MPLLVWSRAPARGQRVKPHPGNDEPYSSAISGEGRGELRRRISADSRKALLALEPGGTRTHGLKIKRLGADVLLFVDQITVASATTHGATTTALNAGGVRLADSARHERAVRNLLACA